MFFFTFKISFYHNVFFGLAWYVTSCQVNKCYIHLARGEYYTFIACWWGKYENVFTQEYHIPWGQCPSGIWYSWVNKFSYFLNPYAMNVLLYRMKPRKHIHVKYCWQTYFKSIGTLSQLGNGRLQVMRSECLWCFPVKEW